MGLLTLPFRLPLMPLRGFIQLGEVLHERAEQELRDPASVRRQLEEAEWAHASGEMSDEDVADVEEEAVGRVLSTPANTAATPGAQEIGADPHG